MSGPITTAEIQAALPSSITIGPILDSGGQGSVFSGTCNDVLSAIKIINPVTTEKKRIEREIRFLKSIANPHIVRLIEHHEIILRGSPFQLLAYELIENGDLSKNLGQPPLPSAAEIAKLGKAVGTAINLLWSAQERVVHRDIKPKNIMVRASGDYVLVDFGFARHVDLSDMTIAGSPGTNGYKSPEQALGRKSLTLKSDIFSLGITLFVFATGKHPFNGQQPFPTTSISQNIFELRKDLEPKLVNIILNMLKSSPVDRPADVTGLFAALEV